MKSALLVIDVQRVLFNPTPQPNNADAIITNINMLTSWARKQNFPVIFVQHEQENTAIAFDSDGWQLQEGLRLAQSDLVVRKTTPDSFLSTNLEQILNENDIEHVIIGGYASEFCVDTTVRRAAGMGYNVSLISDAHTTHDKAHATGAQISLHHNITLTNVTSFKGDIKTITTSECIHK